MKKFAKRLSVKQVDFLREDYILLRLSDDDELIPQMLPGQFVNIAVEGSPNTFLRRPISINFVDNVRNEFDLLIHAVGDGTRALTHLSAGDTLDCLYPLGNGFEVPIFDGIPRKHLLVGGGVGTAPMLLYGQQLRAAGHEPTFLLGGRSQRDILQLDRFSALGRVCITTEDATLGEKGFVTHHSIWQSDEFDSVAACGPQPMMVAVARMAREKGWECFVSLENLMACGIGACLCCVEKTVKGNVCVCTEGPVFNTNELTWE
ncbi:MAG: dihydroorotate dehydrogenase electron transfer subunit [Bacteroidaceae bacterium]|nr:dihydroorotate dehydrogenase electron transfer subunit [Bacteroidaceae bacterium]